MPLTVAATKTYDLVTQPNAPRMPISLKGPSYLQKHQTLIEVRKKKYSNQVRSAPLVQSTRFFTDIPLPS
ncbi:unnamed protein product [Fusarium graminearum]|uniref:Chromosome 3, complete genome n=1 Tax=Gibberella zeae (strain ATCC MYA-4620 / CBS 123657 / FGSC 9075 / NRRL 31084 / PH-1) TaxID=229533 RepID=A0A098DZ95_GIBZE|nr:unnamed protein product [Fusarium graminearum]CZS84122.1 unnamed protein product [Fusarium graminearum]